MSPQGTNVGLGPRYRGQGGQVQLIVVVKDGSLVGEWYFDGDSEPIEAMSATKSIVSLAARRPLLRTTRFNRKAATELIRKSGGIETGSERV